MFSDIPLIQMCAKRITIRGSMVGSMSETDEALEFAARGLVSPIYQVFPFKDFAMAVDLLVGCLRVLDVVERELTFLIRDLIGEEKLQGCWQGDH